MAALLSQESWPESIEHLSLAGVQPVRWSWLALLKDDVWCLWGLSVRGGALETPRRSMHSKGAYLHSESISATEAQDRLRNLKTGPGSSEVGDISYELASPGSPAWWVPPNEHYWVGAANTWPEYRVEWPIKGADDLRSQAAWFAPFRATGIQYPNILEAILIHLYGVRPTQRLLSSNILGNVLLRLPYAYRLGGVAVADRLLTIDIEWSGFEAHQELNVHLSARRSSDQVEPDQLERSVSDVGGVTIFELPYHPIQAELFLNDPQVAVPCDQLRWERSQLLSAAIPPLVLEPEERTVLQQSAHTSRSQQASLFPALTDDETIQNVLCARWEEAGKCLEAGAYLAAMVMIGSVMEGALLATAHRHIAEVMQAASAPKDRSGRPRPLSDWKLDSLVQVSRELNWTPAIMAHFMDVIRTLRNLVHPWEQLRRLETPDLAVAHLCYQTVASLLQQLAILRSNAPVPERS
jgi:hypothetical protein